MVSIVMKLLASAYCACALNEASSLLQLVPRRLDVDLSGHSEHDVLPGKFGKLGIGYIGFGGVDDWCPEVRASLQALRSAEIPCVLDKSCRVVFNTDRADRVAQCRGDFDDVVVHNISACLSQGPGWRATWTKLCARDQLPYNYNIFMDLDTFLVKREKEEKSEIAQIDEIFDVLQDGFDYAAAWECCARGEHWHLPTREEALMKGWEMNTGVVGLANTEAVREHARQTLKLMMEHGAQAYSSVEQSYETRAMARSSLRAFTLPATFNLRQYTVDGFKDLPPVLLHAHLNATKSWPELAATAMDQVNNFVRRR